MQGAGPKLALVPFVGAAIMFMSACDVAQDVEPEFVGVCVHPVTEERLPDEACGDYDDDGHSHNTGSMFVWIQSSQGYPIAPVGQRQYRAAGSSSVTIPRGAAVAKGAPVAGAPNVKSPAVKDATKSQVQRGGLGVNSKSSSGAGKAASGNTGGKSGGS